MLTSLFFAWTAALLPASWNTQHVPAAPAPALEIATAPGWRPVGSHELPSSAVFAPLRGARTLVFDGEHFDVLDAMGALDRRLATLPAFTYPSFVVVDATYSYAYAGESSNDGLYRLDLHTGALAQVGSLHFNYAACFVAQGELFLSASPCGFSCGSDLFALDLATFALTQRGHLPGASGPLARTPAGDLLYGFQADVVPLPGELWIGRWSAQQLAQPAPLARDGAAKFAEGFDGLSALAVDARGGHVFAAITNLAGPSEIVEFDALGRRVGAVATSGAYLSNLVVEEVTTPGALQRYQPRGARLHWLETDFATWPPRTVHRTAEPARPVAQIETGANGRRALRVLGGPPDALAVVVLARGSGAPVTETAHTVGSTLLFAAVPLGSANGVVARCDAHGELSLAWPAPPTGRCLAQVFFLDPLGAPIASSTPVLD